MKRLPKSIRKYIRKEKVRIRKTALDLEEQKKAITALYQKIKGAIVKISEYHE